MAGLYECHPIFPGGRDIARCFVGNHRGWTDMRNSDRKNRSSREAPKNLQIKVRENFHVYVNRRIEVLRFVIVPVWV